MSHFGGAAAHAVSAFRDPAVYDARRLARGQLASRDVGVTPVEYPRRHTRGHLPRLPLLRQLHLDPTTGGLR